MILHLAPSNPWLGIAAILHILKSVLCPEDMFPKGMVVEAAG